MNRTQIEAEIRRVIAEESRAIELSSRLFGPGGLFGSLATSKEERRTVASSPLFKEAQRRFSELKRKEADEFAKAVQKHLAGDLARHRRIKLEESPGN